MKTVSSKISILIKYGETFIAEFNLQMQQNSD